MSADIDLTIIDDRPKAGPQCMFCKHCHYDRTCDAFPSGIPASILNGENDHKNPYPGDNGIRFELLDEPK